MSQNKNPKPHSTHDVRHLKIVFGILIILLGILLLIKNLDLMPAPFADYVISWQSFIIFLGIIVVVKHRGASIGGYILILIGAYSIIKHIYEFPIIPFSVESICKYWPILLIIMGLIIIFKRIYHREDKCRNLQIRDLAQDYFDDFRIFSGAKLVITSQNFVGGKTVAIFGGNEVDCTSAELGTDEVEISLIALFGGSSMIVPQNWNVKTDVFALFGGINDRRKTTEKIDSNKTLLIKGFVIFGGGEIKCRELK